MHLCVDVNKICTCIHFFSNLYFLHVYFCTGRYLRKKVLSVHASNASWNLLRKMCCASDKKKLSCVEHAFVWPDIVIANFSLFFSQTIACQYKLFLRVAGNKISLKLSYSYCTELPTWTLHNIPLQVVQGNAGMDNIRDN